MMSQPAAYQIAHYNIFPAPIVKCQDSDTRLVGSTIQAVLVETSSHLVVEGGFVAGDSHLVASSNDIFEFSGLKLARVTIIKDYLRVFKLDIYKCDFLIEFSVKDDKWWSSEFKIVPTYTALPREYQTQRPYRRRPTIKPGISSQKRKKPEKDENEDSNL